MKILSGIGPGKFQNRGFRSATKYADLVYTGRWDLDIKKNLRTEVNIPVTHIKELSNPGIYFAVLKGAGQYNYYYSSTWFTISDLGLHVKKYKNLMQFQVQSLETALPIQDVLIEGYSKKGERLVDVKTNDKGIARINGATDRLTYVTARKNNSLSLLPMDLPALDLTEFRTATEPFRPIDLFVYGPRDLYRPGETVIIDGLLRNQDGQMTAAHTITANVIRPDGRVVHEFKWKSRYFNYYHTEYNLPSDSITGKWRIVFKHPAGKLKEYNFTVAEFLPETMKLSVDNPDNQTDILAPAQTPVIKLKGDFLYGAPAAGSRANAMIHLKPARKLFDEKWPGYEFGDATETARQSYETDSIKLDEKGVGTLKIKNQWETAKSPLWLTANASLYDSGGRPVVRNKSWQIWPAKILVGIRNLSTHEKDDNTVDGDTTAQFEIIVADQKGNRVATKGLKAVVIKEHREYYWEYRHEAWQWRFSSQFYPVDRFEVDIKEDASAFVNVPVKWGGYRLEIKHPETGLLSSYRIWAGWRPSGSADGVAGNRPDRVELSLDKLYYKAGETAKLTIKAPEGGAGYVFVESDTNLLTLPVTVPARGKTIDIQIEPGWDRHDLYVSALMVRKGESKTGNMPKRSVGLISLPLDRTDRALIIQMNVPKKIEPNQTVDVSVAVKRKNGSVPDSVYVTLAAVDVGILNLSGFKTPSPYEYFFQERKYGVEIHDVYQRLIEANKGVYATQRFGGDAPQLSRGGDRPSTDVQIVAISKTAVKANEDGMASFSFDIPNFNGKVRVMAIAHTSGEYGSGEKNMTIAAPLVTQITMPRFLSLGDKSQVMVDVHNMTDESQDLTLNLDIKGPVTLLNGAQQNIRLEANKRKAFAFPVFARQLIGRSNISLKVDGLVKDNIKRQIQRNWFLDTRPAYPAKTKVYRQMLQPGNTFEVKPDDMASLISKTIGINAVLSSSPPINVADHIKKLFAYPYGCLEQTTSGLFPHVILGEKQFLALDLPAESAAEKNKKIRLGIQRLMEKQKSTGGFGLWSSTSPESYWLTAYVTDFLLHARQAGYEVPATALSKAMERLQLYVERPGTVTAMGYMDQKHYKAAARAYAAFVLARVQSISLGDARSLYASVKKDLKGSLGFVHAGLALALSGDRKMGLKALEFSIKKIRGTNSYYGDYGSDLRDFAMAYYLVSSFYPKFQKKTEYLFLLENELDTSQWLSTQERNSLVMAGAISLKKSDKSLVADIKTGSIVKTLNHSGMKQVTSLKGESADGFSITNKGEKELFFSVTLSGYPSQQPKAQSHGVKIFRRYLTLNGKPFKEAQKQLFKSGDRMMAELSFEADKRMPNCLIVDLLPAGLELEDANLAGATSVDDILVDKKSVTQWHNQFSIRHTEYRDDRFVAALDIRARQRYRIFYAVRVVSPGDFIIPPPLVEDMYRPYIRGLGAAQGLLRVINQ